MNQKLPYGASVLFSVIAIVLLVVNVYITTVVRTKQADLAQRQTTIANGQALAQLNQNLVRAMAESSIKNSDTQMRDLLTAQGITIKSELVPTDKK